MKRTRIGFIAAVAAAAVVSSSFFAPDAMAGRGDGPVVYVPGQDLFYDSIVVTDLPQHGRFQELRMGGPSGLYTEFGPGDPGYIGGRWWVDVNNNMEMDDEDDYFLCPLLGPGRESP